MPLQLITAQLTRALALALPTHRQAHSPNVGEAAPQSGLQSDSSRTQEYALAPLKSPEERPKEKTPSKEQEKMTEQIGITTNEEGTAYMETLEKTARVLTAIKDTLDTGTHSCGSCQNEQKNNWLQFQAFEALSGAIGRIEKANSLIQLSLDKKEGG
jgi:hypothetical protein